MFTGHFINRQGRVLGVYRHPTSPYLLCRFMDHRYFQFPPSTLRKIAEVLLCRSEDKLVLELYDVGHLLETITYYETPEIRRFLHPHRMDLEEARELF